MRRIGIRSCRFVRRPPTQDFSDRRTTMGDRLARRWKRYLSGEERTDVMKTNLAIICVLLLTSSSFGGSYRDKHGNAGTINLGSPCVNSGSSIIDYSLPYTSTDSEGNKSDQYIITSRMENNRDLFVKDFVLSVFVNDDATSNAGARCSEGPLRVTHHVHILEMNGDSFRLNQSQKRRKSPKNA